MVRESMTTRDIVPRAASFSTLSILSDCSEKLWTWNTSRFFMASSLPWNTWDMRSADRPSLSMYATFFPWRATSRAICRQTFVLPAPASP